jgi:DNA repair photolyase
MTLCQAPDIIKRTPSLRKTKVDVTEISATTILVKSRIPGADYVINPYLGCAHGCRYCYAVFMRRYARHHPGAPWGSFVEVKVNLTPVLRAELARKKQPGRVILSSVCDPYQPVELRYRLTRSALKVLAEFGWGIDILTRSPLILRDLDLLKAIPNLSVGLSITTDDDRVRRVLEPQAPPIPARIATLKQLAQAGLSPWVFIAPMLPMNPNRLYELIKPYVDEVMMDPLNYRHRISQVFRRHQWDYELTDAYASKTRAVLRGLLPTPRRRAQPADALPKWAAP